MDEKEQIGHCFQKTPEKWPIWPKILFYISLKPCIFALNLVYGVKKLKNDNLWPKNWCTLAYLGRKFIHFMHFFVQNFDFFQKSTRKKLCLGAKIHFHPYDLSCDPLLTTHRQIWKCLNHVIVSLSSTSHKKDSCSFITLSFLESHLDKISDCFQIQMPFIG